jgi:hypothetical protein
MWVLIGVGILATTSADAAFAVQAARGVPQSGHYDFVWTLGALAISYAAWVRAPASHRDREGVVGMRAIALALIAQALAIGIQIYAFFEEVGRSERLVTVVVLVVASVQIILTRPRGEGGPGEAPLPPDDGATPGAPHGGERRGRDGNSPAALDRRTSG